MAAALLPYESSGRVAVKSFQRHLVATHQAGLINAVNMDTGYVNYLSESEKLEVLGWTRDALRPSVPFVAGAYIETRSGETVALYREQMEPSFVQAGFRYCFRLRGCMGKSAARESCHLSRCLRRLPERVGV